MLISRIKKGVDNILRKQQADQGTKLNDEQVDNVEEFLYLGALLEYNRDKVKPDKLSTGYEEFGTLAKLAGRRKFNCSKRL